MHSLKPPAPIPEEGKLLFLAGSIEMGAATNWQTEVEEALRDTPWVLLNPRRDDWDSSWEQIRENPQFKEQVTWELTGLERAERILLFLDPNTKSPVSLIELGLFAGSGKLIVVCPDGFWRKGNVDITCDRYGVTQVPTLNEALTLLKSEAR